MKWKALLFLLFFMGCSFKIVIPNNFKTEHLFRVKLEYPQNPLFIDTLGQPVPDSILPDTVRALIYNSLGVK